MRGTSFLLAALVCPAYLHTQEVRCTQRPRADNVLIGECSRFADTAVEFTRRPSGSRQAEITNESHHRRPSAAKVLPAGLAVADSAVVQWLRANAIALTTTQAGSGPNADLAPLRAIIGDARLVLLGEATHGTREFFQLKHRFIEYLATSLGFGTLITEAEWGRVRDAMSLLASPGGSADSALATLRRWNLTSEPALALLQWIQQYNRAAGTERLAVYGMDAQDGWHSAARLLEYLRRTDAVSAADLAAAIRPIDGRSGNFEAIRAYSRLAPAELASVSSGIDSVLMRLDRRKAEYIARSSANAWADAAHNARVLQQSERMWRDARWPDVGAMRDRFLADNVLAIVERNSARAIVWAHNGHAMRAPWVGRETLGGHLSRTLGSRMVVVGFAFNEGEFRARIPNGGAVATHRVGPAPEGSISAMLARVGLPMFMVDLRNAPKSGPVADWLLTAHPERSIGAEFRAEAEPVAIAPGASYDVLVFVANTTLQQRR